MIAVLQKLFLILQVFADQGDPLSLARLTQATGLPKPTIYRAVQSMVDLGYLAQDSTTGHYLRTAAFETLGRGSQLGHLKQRIQPKLESLLAKFDESVSLTVMTGLRVQCLVAAETTRPLCYRLGQGNGSLPFYATASGRAIVSQLPREEIESLLAQTKLEALTPKTVRSKARLKAILDQSRKNGWGFQDEECELGVVCVAVPIIEGDRPIASLAIIVPVQRFSDSIRRAMIVALKEAAS